MIARHRLFKVLSVLLTLLGHLIGPTSATPASAAYGHLYCYFIAAQHSGHYLDVEGGSGANGARIIQWYRTYATNQKFEFQQPPNQAPDIRIIESDASDKVLTVSSYAAGATVVQQPYTGAATQWWQEIPAFPSGYKYRNVATGLYLDVNGASYGAGAPLVVWYGNTSLNQQFASTRTSCS